MNLSGHSGVTQAEDAQLRPWVIFDGFIEVFGWLMSALPVSAEPGAGSGALRLDEAL
jgi:hypothetical protein